MLAATAGVNTHRGANFSFGFLLGALGWLMQQQSLQQIVTADFAPLFPTVAQVTQGVAGDFGIWRKKPAGAMAKRYMSNTALLGFEVRLWPVIRLSGM